MAGGSTQSVVAGGWDVLLARLGTDGRFEPWLGALGTPWNDHGSTLLATRDGSLLLGGYSQAASEDAGAPDLMLAHVQVDSIEHHREGIEVNRIR